MGHAHLRPFRGGRDRLFEGQGLTALVVMKRHRERRARGLGTEPQEERVRATGFQAVRGRGDLNAPGVAEVKASRAGSEPARSGFRLPGEAVAVEQPPTGDARPEAFKVEHMAVGRSPRLRIGNTASPRTPQRNPHLAT